MSSEGCMCEPIDIIQEESCDEVREQTNRDSCNKPHYSETDIAEVQQTTDGLDQYCERILQPSFVH